MRALVCVPFLLFSSLAFAEEAYLGMYLQGQKIGFSSYIGSTDTFQGKPARKSETRMLMSAAMLGSPIQMKVDSVSWTTEKGQPLRMEFTIESAGRTQRITAVFSSTSANIAIDNNGVKKNQVLPLPKDAPIVDDAVSALLADNIKPGEKRDFYILDPTTVSFIKNSAVLGGPTTVTVKGKTMNATLVTLKDPRADTKIFLDAKGEMIKAEAPLGIEMWPEPKQVALAMPPPRKDAGVDLAAATSLVPDKPLENPMRLSRLKIEIDGRDLAGVPNDSHQKVTGSGEKWVLDVKPLDIRNLGAAIPTDATAKKWTESSVYMNSNSDEWKPILNRILGNAKTLDAKVKAIHNYVYRRMRANPGIGVLRNASEVHQTREGVCRDYAILTGTLLRAAGVPTRLAGGLVSWDGTFYYHAWVEVWNGKDWYAVDSTSPDLQVSAAHIKLSEGNVDTALAFPFLGRAQIRVLATERR